jgi:hypothetical protein
MRLFARGVWSEKLKNTEYTDIIFPAVFEAKRA